MCCKRARPHKGRPTSLIRDIRDRASGGNQTYEASHPSRARPSEPNSTPPTGPAGLLMQPETASAINTGGPLHELASQVDANAVRAKIRSSSSPVVVAVLPAAAAQEAGGASKLAGQISSGLGRSVTVGLVAGSSILAGPGATAEKAATDSLNRSRSRGLTAVLTDFVGTVQAAPRSGSSGSGGSGSTSTSSSGGGSSGAGVVVLLVLLLLGALGLGGFVVSRRRRRERELSNLKADVRSVLDRLGGDVTTLDPGDNAVARQAINDASERYTAAGGMIASADTPEKLAVVRRTALEGLAMTRVARKALGFDPGPEIEPAPSSAQQLTAAERVRVGDRDYEGYPAYTPGAPHYFGGGMVGGGFVPGGWYAMPFWEGMMILSLIHISEPT